MENMLGLLRIRVKRGIDLAIRDFRSSDPYVVIRLGKQVFISSSVFILNAVLWDSDLLKCCLQNLSLALQTLNMHNFKTAPIKLKTRVVNKCLNPEWNEDLTLCVTDPNQPVKLMVYDKDTFSFDDKMGDAEFEIKPFLEAVKMNLKGIPSGTIITRLKPGRQNCLVEESDVTWENGEVVQNMFLRLRNVERGEVEVELRWTDVPGARGL
ncbi:hypothetical protein V2J09_003603 [Rumex salicifolius]